MLIISKASNGWKEINKNCWNWLEKWVCKLSVLRRCLLQFEQDGYFLVSHCSISVGVWGLLTRNSCLEHLWSPSLSIDELSKSWSTCWFFILLWSLVSLFIGLSSACYFLLWNLRKFIFILFHSYIPQRTPKLFYFWLNKNMLVL